MTFVVDEDDYSTIQAEIAKRQAEGRTGVLPEGESDLVGSHIAEMIRDLDDYRSLYDRDHPTPPATLTG